MSFGKHMLFGLQSCMPCAANTSAKLYSDNKDDSTVSKWPKGCPNLLKQAKDPNNS